MVFTPCHVLLRLQQQLPLQLAPTFVCLRASSPTKHLSTRPSLCSMFCLCHLLLRLQKQLPLQLASTPVRLRALSHLLPPALLLL
jgi:hypothetical protein